MPETIFVKLGMYEYIMAPEPISTAYFINPPSSASEPVSALWGKDSSLVKVKKCEVPVLN
jgi:hypothetical protein